MILPVILLLKKIQKNTQKKQKRIQVNKHNLSRGVRVHQIVIHPNDVLKE